MKAQIFVAKGPKLWQGEAMRSRVLVAMSGGVDSSVAAALLKDEGYEVVGVTLHLWDYPDVDSVKGRCCAPEDIHDARRVADHLGFPHYAFDRRELFEREVVGPFVDEYLAGRTPSPCVRCNRGVKIQELITLAGRLEASHVATGHYARTRTEGRRVELLRGADRTKDQSYFLHMLDDATLGRFMFPLGALDKSKVRARALELNLPGANKGESQELCFVPTGRYDELIEARAPERVQSGQIVDGEGSVLGNHAGIHKFTRGQRRNLGIATGERAYVVDVDASSGLVKLGTKEDLLTSSIALEEVSLRVPLASPFETEVVVRYQGAPRTAQIILEPGGRARVHFAEPITRPSAGQYAVFYEGDRVLGGGLITDRRRSEPAAEALGAP